MIRLYTGSEYRRHRREMAEIFHLRKRVFHDLLNWDVKIEDAWERDGFDEADPIHVASYHDGTGRLRGALRLLPTTGPNMLADTFPELIGDGGAISDPAVWESSRFCIDPDITQARASNQVTVAAAELMCGVGELALHAGITAIVTVTDVFLERMGCPAARIGPPRRIGRVQAVAVRWAVDAEMIEAMKGAAGIGGDVLDRPMDWEALRRVA